MFLEKHNLVYLRCNIRIKPLVNSQRNENKAACNCYSKESESCLACVEGKSLKLNTEYSFRYLVEVNMKYAKRKLKLFKLQSQKWLD